MKLCAWLLMTASLVSCGGQKAKSVLPKDGSGKQIVTIGTSSISKDVLEVAVEDFNRSNKDYKVDIKVFDVAVTPNIATQDVNSACSPFLHYGKGSFVLVIPGAGGLVNIEVWDVC